MSKAIRVIPVRWIEENCIVTQNFTEDRYNCPNCGAPITYTGKCPYCGTIISWTPHCETVYVQHVQGETKELAAKCVLPRYRGFPHSGINPDDLVTAVDHISHKISDGISKYLTVVRWYDLESNTDTIVGKLKVVEPEKKWYEKRELLK